MEIIYLFIVKSIGIFKDVSDKEAENIRKY